MRVPQTPDSNPVVREIDTAVAPVREETLRDVAEGIDPLAQEAVLALLKYGAARGWTMKQLLYAYAATSKATTQ